MVQSFKGNLNLKQAVVIGILKMAQKPAGLTPHGSVFALLGRSKSLLLASSGPPSFVFACLLHGRQAVLHPEKIIKNRLKVLKFDRVLAVWGRMTVLQ